MASNTLLKFIGLDGAGLVLPATPLLPASRLISKPVKIYDNYLKGVEYYDLGKCYKEIKVGDAVILQRFGDHRYDRFAIGVQWKEIFVGYLPALENIVMANLMDAGAQLQGLVTAKHSFHEFGVGVWTELIVGGEAPSDKLSDHAADSVGDIYRKESFYECKKRKK